MWCRIRIQWRQQYGNKAAATTTISEKKMDDSKVFPLDDGRRTANNATYDTAKWMTQFRMRFITDGRVQSIRK